MSDKNQAASIFGPRAALICGQGEGGIQAEAKAMRVSQVRHLAAALAEIGYRVTVFLRAGCAPDGAPESWSEKAPGTGSIQVVVIPQSTGRNTKSEEATHCLERDTDWLAAFVAAEATKHGCLPWRHYEFLHSFFWDAGMLAWLLQCRWRAEATSQAAEKMLGGVVPEPLMRQAISKRVGMGTAEDPAYLLGKLLLESDGSPATPLLQRARMASVRFSRLRGNEGGTEADQLMGAVATALADARLASAPAMHELIVADALGEALLELSPSVSHWLEEEFEWIDRHLWTPCSLATQEEEHQPERSVSALRRRRLEDRRSHEQVICDHSNAFMVTSLEVAEHLLFHYHVPYEQMFFFPTCVDRQLYRPRLPHELEPALDLLAHATGLERERLSHSRLVLECGPSEPSQRKETVLDAFSFVARECNDTLLIMTLDPESKLAADLKARRDSRAELRQRVFFIERPEPAQAGPLFSLADIFVSAAEREREGAALLQAAACGTAVVCSDRLSLAINYLQPEAVIVPSSEVFDFARAIIDLLDDEHSRSERGAQLANKAIAFDWKNQACALLEYLRRRGFQVALPSPGGTTTSG